MSSKLFVRRSSEASRNAAKIFDIEFRDETGALSDLRRSSESCIAQNGVYPMKHLPLHADRSRAGDGEMKWA